MKTLFLLLISLTFVSAQYTLDWEIEQDGNDFGSIYYDLNDDGIKELGKFWLNTVSFYDGANEFSPVWQLESTDFEYLTLWNIYELDGNIKKAIFSSSSFYDTLTAKISAYSILSTQPSWETETFNASIYNIDSEDLDDDNQSELIFSLNFYDDSDTSYTSQLHILNALTGETEWLSEMYSGYMVGPYIGDMDGDNINEIVFNVYDYKNEFYTIHSIEYQNNTPPNYPNWTVNPNDYEFNMVLTGALFFDGVESFDENDIVGAFVNDECVGVASPTYFPVTEHFTVNLMLYSNETIGDAITFKAYNNDDDLVYDFVQENIEFSANDIIGDDINPFEINASSASQMVLNFPVGWNWFSLNLENENMDVNFVLESLGNSGSLIKNQTGFATYYQEFGWYGLDTFDVSLMYMIEMSEYSDLIFSGFPADTSIPINLNEGWNWIGYLLQGSTFVNDALASIEDHGEMIKNQTSFATYYEGYGWYGFESMNPGVGYMLKMRNSTSLIYSPPPEIVAVPRECYHSENTNFDFRQFEYNMSVIGAVEINGDECTNSEITISAFCENEIRGTASLQKFPLNERYEFNMMIYGNTEDEQIRFEVIDTDNISYQINEKLQFEINGIIGDGFNPLLLKTDANIPLEFQLYKSYPNPFNPVTTMSYQLPAHSSVLLAIYNVNGQLIEELVSSGSMQEAGFHQVIWDASNYSSGIYFVKLTTDNNSIFNKITLLK
ncbi:MAG: T9SS type A sorting domain-containing protein [Candidatus Marinimicrobia bacterium]|nr:T9SS type A sorting domain-containing protein [Candidatus Neomarinimicrobiota bacterium]MBL7022447.1 T9SS type A sorting domain-containing protein [Candidatus Neomarinimicrobiota bacterium]MBL7108698.1 T9SS type A sorting domain-containing protein [Candidatus Neomarinimicrobiota bacterium]